MKVEPILGLRGHPSRSRRVNLIGKWRNQHDSEMEISVDLEGTITGSFRTNVGSPSPGEEFALVGFCAGDLVSFTVNFGRHGSLATWTGQHNAADGVEKLETLWHLARDIRDPERPDDPWAGILAGADTFHRV